MKITAKRLKEIRLKLGLSQNDLAIKSETTQATISRAESNSNSLTIQTLYKICKALDCTSDYLIGLIDTPKKIDN